MNENNGSTMSFDRMRNMLVRAAEVRDSEQQQIFDALDEIHARMSPLESVGAMRKRLSELPDKTEVGVLAERLDEALRKLETTDNAIAELTRSVESIVDKLAKPFAELDGRLDGMAGRFEGVAGRMDGLEDKLQHIHKRIDELDGHLDKQDGKLDEMPRTVRSDVGERIEMAENNLRGRVEESESATKQQLEAAQRELQQATTSTGEQTAAKVDKSHLLLHGKLDETKEALDSSDRLDAQGARLDTLDNKIDALAGRLEEAVSRLDTTENTLSGKLTELSGTVGERPTTESVREVVRAAHEQTGKQHAGHLDEAMATFAELIIGGGPQPMPQQQLPAPRQQPRRNNSRSKSASKSGSKSSSSNNSSSSDDSDDES